MDNNVLATALTLAKRGWLVFPCRETKAPACPGGFKAATKNPDAIHALFARHRGALIGIATGIASGVSVIDLDHHSHPEAAEWWDRNNRRLSETLIIGSRSGGTHLYFLHTPGLRCSASKIAPGVDVRAEGGYVIFWPGFGGSVRLDAPLAPWPVWLAPGGGGGAPEVMQPAPALEDLLADPAAANAWAARAAVGVAWRAVSAAPSGTRNTMLNQQAHALGLLVRAGELLPEPTQKFLAEAAKTAGLPAREAARTIESAFTAAEKTHDADDLVAHFNKECFVLNDAGKTFVGRFVTDPMFGRRTLERSSFKDFQDRNANVKIQIQGKAVSAAKVWLEHPCRRQYLDGVRFDPTGAEIPGRLNLWTGWGVVPRPGEWSAMRAHIERVVCNNDPEQIKYVIGWLGRLVQHPNRAGEVALVLRGKKGTGKGLLGNCLLKIAGQHGLKIDRADHLIGKFNAHQRDAVFLFADEAFFAGDREHTGCLKSIITEPTLTIEAKFQNVIQVPNYLHIMMASNSDWVVPATGDERRFCVLDVSEEFRQNYQYFNGIYQQLENGGYEAMLHDLLALDLSNYNHRAVPVTKGLSEQKMLSATTVELWWQDCLSRGTVPGAVMALEAVPPWPRWVRTEALYESYAHFSERRGDRRFCSLIHFGKVLARFGGRRERDRGAGRPWGYSFWGLERARGAFEREMGGLIEW